MEKCPCPFFPRTVSLSCRRHSLSYQSMSMTTVPEPLSVGLMMMSCRRIRRFRAPLSRLVKLSPSLVSFVLTSCWSMVLQKAEEASRPGWGVHADLVWKAGWGCHA